MARVAAKGSQQKPVSRRATNVTPSDSSLQEARDLRINASQACKQGPAVAIAKTQADRWLQENRPALDAWNDYVEQHGVPPAEFRQF